LRAGAPFWAKLSADQTEFHPVLCHLVDVGQVCHHLWSHALRESVRGRLSAAVGLDAEAAGRWVAFWVGAHDIGKVAPGFQAKGEAFRSRLRQLGYAFPPDPSPPPHGTVSAAVLRDALAHPSGWPALDPSLASRVAVAVGGHHGVFPRAEQTLLGRTALGDRRWSEARLTLLADLAAVFGLAELPAPWLELEGDHAAFILLAGLCSVADWVGSSQDHFPFAGGTADLASYPPLAAKRAADALESLGWTVGPGRPSPASFERLFGVPPRPLQACAEDYARSVSGPGLALVEAPTGEGKTEAALFLADAWARLGQGGLYVALPTQATSNQMFGRVRRFLTGRYPEDRVNLHLLHGHALLSDEYQELRLAAVYDDDAGVEGRVVAEGWFAPKKRGLLAPYGVGTIDQALLAVLQTKHGFVRLFGLAGKTVVLDEVHAYDAYMSELLERLVAWLASLGASVVLLSATLPKAKREALCRAFAGPNLSFPEEAPYPRLLTIEGGAARSRSFPAARTTAVRLVRVSGGDLPSRLNAALTGGGCVAVLCNTVGRAQETYITLRDTLCPAGVEVELFHARFPFGQRDDIERRVLSRYGKDGAQRPGAAVLVATQVVEQSLDLDFDLMVSEHAPVDLLLQRAGRLHRHPDRGRPPALAEPVLWLLEPDGSDSGGVPCFGNSEFVYDRHVLLRSYLALADMSGVRLPDDLEGLIEAVYGDRPLAVPDANWREALDASRRDLDTRRERDRLAARRLLVKPPDYPDDLLEDFCQQLEEENPEVHPTLQALTRLGEPTVQVVCLCHTPNGPKLDPTDPRPLAPGRVPDLGEAKRLLRASLTLNHGGVVRHLLAQDVPPGWRQSALLRYHRAAVFDAGFLRAGAYTVRLDPELGAVIAKSGGRGVEA
jgi:CRISPR-associated endonuclease/helicase Cas3